ncbi:MAG TPA: hypothetical protein VHD36_06430 [Pirellulales bacterium]|nr:hypothetical protein [Pirellulales bacterium]
MATITERPQLESHVTALFERLRARIRRYVALEGVGLCVVALCLAFWSCLALDWVFEPVAWVRRGLLIAGAVATGAVFYQLVVRRLAVPLPDSRLALLLERRFRSFDDSLLTSVDMTQSDRELGDLAREMLDSTLGEAGRQAQHVKLDDVFRREPLRRAIGSAGLSAATLVVALLTVPGTLLFGVERLTGMTNDPWPRRVRLVVPGFEDGVKVVARGDDVDVLVQADLSMPSVPEVVQIRYVTDEGVRGRETMTRTGNAVANQDAFQDFRHTFNNVLSSLTFEVAGGDARVRDLAIHVVDSPTIAEATLVCEYPGYMNRSPRELRVTGAMQVPLGTKVTVRARASKDLRRAEISYPIDASTNHTESIDLPQQGNDLRTIQFQLPDLAADTTLNFTLFDTDGIHNRRPFVVSLSAVADEPPQLSLQLQGIGSAITPLARLPLVGQMVDDYGVASAAFQLTVDDKETVRAPLADAPAGRSEIEVDEAFEVRDLGLKAGQKVLFGAEAQDAYHLADGDQPHTATSERFQLDVVTPETLRTMLESRELNLRQRFETIISEMSETRDSLAQPPESGGQPADEDKSDAESPADQAATDQPPSAEHAAQRHPKLDLRVERAKQNCEKNGQETLGVATGFDEILEELVNNRVDTEELRVRLRNRIAEPLRGIGEQMFPECDRRLQALLTAPGDATARTAAIEQADAILVAMEQIRDQMLELESFNEAVDMLRSIIGSEKALQEQVRERQKRKVRDLLEDSE